MAKTYSKRIICTLSLGGFIFAYHSYKNAQWIRFLCDRQKFFDLSASRSLLPEIRYSSSVITKETTRSSVAYPDDEQSERFPLCSREQIKYGRWVPKEAEKPPYISRTKHLRCYPDEFYKQVPWNTWAWKPSDEACSMTEWNADDFCRLMNKSTISIVGDSLSWEQYSSLLQLLGQKVRQTDQHKSKSENRNHLQLACDSDTRIVFRNDPRLSFLSDSIRSDFPLVLVLNRGAHYVNDTELTSGTRKIIAELREWQTTCRRMGLRCHMYWRTTVPGHPRCTEFNETEPFGDFRAMENRILDPRNYDNITINYHWQDFARQNEIVLRELESSGLAYNVIDGYHLNILRPDEHRFRDGDCLHNCYPGKMDVYNQLLLHFLRMERSEEDVESLLQMYEKAKARRSTSDQVQG